MNKSAQWASYHNLQPGDVIKSPKSLANMIQHYSLFWGYDAQGHAWVVENVVGHGVIFNRMDLFMWRVGTINSIQPFRGTEWARQQVIDRAAQRVGWKYDALNYNCEHFVNDVLHGESKSQQADNARGVLGSLFTIALVAVILRAA